MNFSLERLLRKTKKVHVWVCLFEGKWPKMIVGSAYKVSISVWSDPTPVTFVSILSGFFLFCFLFGLQVIQNGLPKHRLTDISGCLLISPKSTSRQRDLECAQQVPLTPPELGHSPGGSIPQ